MLKIYNLKKSYKDNVILKNISLKISKGDVISIIGKSGSGKSTLLKCINRLEEIDYGEIIFNNVNIRNIPLLTLRQKIGFVFQNYNLFDNLTVMNNLTIGLIKIKKIDKNKAELQAKKMLKKFDLLDKIDNYPDELSGGEKQRIAIIRTILMKPELIILDELTSALDYINKKKVLSLINELAKKNMTLLIVSHEEEFVKKVSNKIFKIDNGIIKEVII